MGKLSLNKQRLASLDHNLDLLDRSDMNSLQGGINKGGLYLRTDTCTDGYTSGCSDGCGIFGTIYNCTNSYCTDDCPGGIPSTTTDIACNMYYGHME